MLVIVLVTATLVIQLPIRAVTVSCKWCIGKHALGNMHWKRVATWLCYAAQMPA